MQAKRGECFPEFILQALFRERTCPPGRIKGWVFHGRETKGEESKVYTKVYKSYGVGESKNLKQGEGERSMENILVRNDAETDERHGWRPEKRPVERLIQYGIININKPAGPTSHQISEYVKKMLNVKKAGHSGTLDPKVTGVLPIATAQATRVVDVLLKSNKEYIALMHLHKEEGENKVREVMREFTGEIKQTPPRRSAVKRQERRRRIDALEILEVQGKEILCRISCQAGTYIRTLIHHIGLRLGTGAHMTQLIRTKTGPFTYKTWHTLHDVKDAIEFYKQGNEREIRKIVVPFEAAVVHLPKIWVNDSAVDTLCHGSPLGIPGVVKMTAAVKSPSTVALMTLKEELIGLATAQVSAEEIMQKEKGLAARVTKVFMERGVYPPYKKKEKI